MTGRSPIVVSKGSGMLAEVCRVFHTDLERLHLWADGTAFAAVAPVAADDIAH